MGVVGTLLWEGREMETVKGEKLLLEKVRRDKEFVKNIERDYIKMKNIQKIVDLLKGVPSATREQYDYGLLKNLVEGKVKSSEMTPSDIVPQWWVDSVLPYL